MKCSDVRRMISRGLDGEQGGERVVEDHCAVCAGCRDFREMAVSGFSAHSSAREVEPPASLLPRILSAVEAAPRPSPFGGWVRFAIPAAAAVSAAVGIWIGGLMHERYAVSPVAEGDVLGLSYLDEYPPNSFGDILTESSSGGGGNHEE